MPPLDAATASTDECRCGFSNAPAPSRRVLLQWISEERPRAELALRSRAADRIWRRVAGAQRPGVRSIARLASASTCVNSRPRTSVRNPSRDRVYGLVNRTNLIIHAGVELGHFRRIRGCAFSEALRHRSDRLEVMVLNRAKRAIELVNKWGASGDLKAGYIVVSDSIKILHKRAQAIAVRGNEHRPT
jgi:hypothetical protein